MLNRVINQANFLTTLLAKPQREELRVLANYLYKDAPAESLAEIGEEDLLNTLNSLFKLLQHRQGSEFKVNINALTDKSDYHVVEIVGPDIPFLVESISNELRQQNFNVHLIIHSTVNVERDGQGKMQNLHGESKETLMQFFISHYTEASQHAGLKERLKQVLHCVALTVEDWKPMLQQMQNASDHLFSTDYTENIFIKNETVKFLQWLISDNFIFLGSAQFNMQDDHLVLAEDGKMGLLRSELYPVDIAQIPAPQVDMPLCIRKSDDRSVVHRTSSMDMLVITKYDASGKKCKGAFFFLGFFTSAVYYQSVRNIPLMRAKVNHVIQRYGYVESSHNAKELITAIEAFPRGELLQISEDELYEISTAIVSLGLVPQVKMFVRRDELSNFLSCLVFIPKNKFSTEVANLVQKTLEKELKGSIARQYVQVGESQLARLQFLIKIAPEDEEDIDISAIEQLIINAASSWDENLHKELLKQLPRQQASRLYAMFHNAFDIKYTASFNAAQAVKDIQYLTTAMQENGICFDISSDVTITGCPVYLKIYTLNQELALSATLPIIETLGLRAQDVVIYEAKINCANNNQQAYIHLFRLYINNACIDITPAHKANIEHLLSLMWQGKMEEDRFNSLALFADLHWQEIIMLRAYAKYLKQLSFSLGQEYIIEAMLNNLAICQQLVSLFKAKFSPQAHVSAEELELLAQNIIDDLANVQNITEDKVLRVYLQLIMATKRTNFYQCTAEGEMKEYLSFKVKSGELSEIPLPKPGMEIFVYSPRLEAVHLRGVESSLREEENDKHNNFQIVARGGLRWSDRKEDFRTEVLGLLKAQMTKNAIIVPVGSKGGFVLKKISANASREELMQEGVACYKTFLRGLLDITDNVLKGRVQTPADVIAYDNHDPYLVVAADKGTATFSDYANEIAAEYNFWLGDAFASGGSAGYDHKKMGITAKGAWISVEHHFAELGIDIATKPFTVVGVGDMSGDVFGNGMLLSRQIKLVAAFNHMHIFLDPNPDVQSSYEERARLFALPRSQWSDYNQQLISKGGGVFARKTKSIAISPEMQNVLGIDAKALSPDDLIKAILTAPVDLLWNGGIGTYVKAASEGNEIIGDKTNDALRVNGRNLHCRVLAEGGNLGCTQRGRIEYASCGGRINTDFIDNSAGVDCSDHEVNIKIAFAEIIANKQVSIEQRNQILATMAPEVEKLVLQDNYMQNQLLSIEEFWGSSRIEEHAWLIKQLESAGELDRNLECLPAIDELQTLIGNNSKLPRPSIAVLSAYAKNSVYQKLCSHNFATEDFFHSTLLQYFPKALQEQYKEALLQHKLGNEIIATMLTNHFVNVMGCCCMHQLLDETSYSPKEIVKAFMLIMDIYNIKDLWRSVEKLHGMVPAAVQVKLFRGLQDSLLQGMLWLLHNTNIARISADEINTYREGVLHLQQEFAHISNTSMHQELDAAYNEYIHYPHLQGVVKPILKLKISSASLEIIKIAQKTSNDLLEAGRLYYHLGEEMHLTWLLSLVDANGNYRYMDALALKNLTMQINKLHHQLIIKELKLRNEHKKALPLNGSINFASPAKIQRYNAFIQELKVNNAQPLVSTLTIAVAKVHDMFLHAA